MSVPWQLIALFLRFNAPFAGLDYFYVHLIWALAEGIHFLTITEHTRSGSDGLPPYRTGLNLLSSTPSLMLV